MLKNKIKTQKIILVKINKPEKIERRNIHQAKIREIQMPEKFTDKITQTCSRISSKHTKITFFKFR